MAAAAAATAAVPASPPKETDESRKRKRAEAGTPSPVTVQSPAAAAAAAAPAATPPPDQKHHSKFVQPNPLLWNKATIGTKIKVLPFAYANVRYRQGADADGDLWRECYGVLCRSGGPADPSEWHGRWKLLHINFRGGAGGKPAKYCKACEDAARDEDEDPSFVPEPRPAKTTKSPALGLGVDEQKKPKQKKPVKQREVAAVAAEVERVEEQRAAAATDVGQQASAAILLNGGGGGGGGGDSGAGAALPPMPPLPGHTDALKEAETKAATAAVMTALAGAGGGACPPLSAAAAAAEVVMPRVVVTAPSPPPPPPSRLVVAAPSHPPPPPPPPINWNTYIATPTNTQIHHLMKPQEIKSCYDEAMACHAAYQADMIACSAYGEKCRKLADTVQDQLRMVLTFVPGGHARLATALSQADRLARTLWLWTTVFNSTDLRPLLTQAQQSIVRQLPNTPFEFPLDPLPVPAASASASAAARPPSVL